MSPLRKVVTLKHNGDAFEVYLEPYGSGVIMDKVLRFRNNQNVTGVEEDFPRLDRATRRAIIRAVNKVFRKTIYPRTKING